MTQGANDDDAGTGPDDYYDQEPLLELASTEREPEDRPWQLVTLDGVPMHVREPKAAFFIDLASKQRHGTYEGLGEAQELILTRVFAPESADLIRARLADDDDDFDVDDLGDAFSKLRAMWGKGRGGSASASTPPRRRSGRPSTARSRSRE